MFEIVRSKFESDISCDFVAFGNLIDNEKGPYHTAFVIKHNNNLFEFHYTGASIEYITLKRDYYHKVTKTISPNEIPAFIARCLNILKNANPKYGYFYNGESYDSNGEHLSNTDFGESMTCVGFCFNVLKGFLDEDYIKYDDWSGQQIHDPIWLIQYCKDNNIDMQKVIQNHRRITPIESLTSAFFHILPITKADIESKLEYVAENLKNRLQVHDVP